MEMEGSPSAPVVAKKLWNILRIVMLMLRKGKKPISDLNLLLKRGKLAITNTLTRRHSSSLSRPREYEFSCTNSPAITHYPPPPHRRYFSSSKYDDVLTATAVQRVLEMLNNNNHSNSGDVAVEGTGNYSPFGKSPIGVKKLRITDSPFPLKEDEQEEDNHVDLAAEEFIKRFYINLNSQPNNNYLDSPYYSYNNNYSWVR